MLNRTPARPIPAQPAPVRERAPATVVDLQLRVLPRHVAVLTRWLQAGRRMGLCDASAFQSGPGRPPSGRSKPGHADCMEPTTDYVLIWVRENPDPAYMVTPGGSHWVVTDCVRRQVLGRIRSFEEALHFIRPVLDASRAA